MRICLFEDKESSKLLPLCFMRPVWELVCGAGSIKENLENLFGAKIKHFFSVRDYIHPKEELKGEFLFINGRILADESFVKVLKRRDRIFISERGKVVALRGTLEDLLQVLENPLVRACRFDAQYIIYPWDLLRKSKVQNPKSKIEKGVKISKFVERDETNGPIIIGEGTVIHPFTILRGPLYIGKHCRIAGEVSSSVIMSYVNKAHYGFIGDSYICSWVNLGAGTTNSNLKNNYGNIKVYNNGEMKDSKQSFLGCFIGDHAKTAIGTMINTGSVIGPGANIFGGKPIKKFVPSFSWGAGGEMDIEKAIETAKLVMSRRKVELTEDYAKLMRKVFELTKSERQGKEERGNGNKEENKKEKTLKENL